MVKVTKVDVDFDDKFTVRHYENIDSFWIKVEGEDKDGARYVFDVHLQDKGRKQLRKALKK